MSSHNQNKKLRFGWTYIFFLVGHAPTFTGKKKKSSLPLPSPTNHPPPPPSSPTNPRLNLILSNGQNLRSRPGRFDFSALFQPPKKLELPRSRTRTNSGKLGGNSLKGFSGGLLFCCGGYRLPCLRPKKRMCPVSIFTPWEVSHKTIDNF